MLLCAWVFIFLEYLLQSRAEVDWSAFEEPPTPRLFHKGCTIVHFHEIIPHLHQSLVWLGFLNIAVLLGMVLILSFLVAACIEHRFLLCLAFYIYFRRDICSDALPISKVG